MVHCKYGLPHLADLSTKVSIALINMQARTLHTTSIGKSQELQKRKPNPKTYRKTNLTNKLDLLKNRQGTVEEL